MDKSFKETYSWLCIYPDICATRIPSHCDSNSHITIYTSNRKMNSRRLKCVFSVTHGYAMMACTVQTNTTLMTKGRKNNSKWIIETE